MRTRGEGDNGGAAQSGQTKASTGTMRGCAAILLSDALHYMSPVTACIHTYASPHIPKFLHIIHTYLQTYTHNHIHTLICTYTYTDTYIHACIVVRG